MENRIFQIPSTIGHRTWRPVFLAVLFLFSAGLFTGAEEPIVRVQILPSQTHIYLTPLADYLLTGSGIDRPVGMSAGQRVRFHSATEGIILSTGPATARRLTPPLQIKQVSAQDGIRIEKVAPGVDWAHENEKFRTYPGGLEIHLLEDGNLELISVVPLEEYLRGVVPFEIGSTVPMEALKAQAVAARSETIHALRTRKYAGEHYDLCSDIMCQVYGGLTRATKRTDEAIRSTQGLILFYNGQVAAALYSANCGGHTEHAENAWPDNPPAPHCVGHYDGEGAFDLDLSQESTIRQWVQSKPKAYCHPDNPGIPEYAKRKFRWQRRIPANEMQSCLNKHQALGRIKELKSLRRGVSGRLIELEFVGEKGSTVIGPELAIRRLFDPPLYSAAFVVDVEGSGPYPEAFILQGAGSGHGVGMCQIGVMAMAAQGKTFREILTHYYQGVEINIID